MVTNVNCKLIVAIALLATATTVIIDSSANEQPHYYARLSQDLRDLAQRDFQTAVQLKQFRKQRSFSGQPPLLLVAIADRYLQDFASSMVNGLDEMSETEHVREAGWNPLAIFRIINRVAHFFKHLRQQPNNGFPDLPLNVLLKKAGGAGGIPLRDDLADAADGILWIYFMYDLNVTDIASGKVRGVQTRTKLLATHCFYIGMVAKIRKQFTSAVEWLREAGRLAKLDGTVDVSSVQVELIDTIRQHDNLHNSKDYSQLRHSDEYFFMTPLNSLNSVLEEKNNLKVKQVLQKQYAGKGRNCSYWSVNTWSLCSGENLGTPQASSHLFCWFEFKVNKAFAIGPLKMEFLSRYPDVAVFHDAFGEDWTKEMWTKADSANVGARKLDDTLENRINRKTAAMTGLRTTKATAAELTQVMRQLPGDHADVHVDSQPELFPENEEDRVATLMIYLNDMHQGGHTVFPTTFATAVPAKGSAIFWFNLLSDGSADFSTAHVECPVVLGEKSVAYKWIRSYDQFTSRKCLLEPKTRFPILVNGKEHPVPNTLHHEVIDGNECQNAQLLSANVAKEMLDGYRVPHSVVPKYGYTSIHSLRSLIRLEWQIYLHVKNKGTNVRQSGMHAEGFHVDQTIQRYLHDFNESAYKPITANYTNSSVMAAVVLKLAKNPLAVYRTLWRFENYVKKWMMAAGEEPSELSPALCQIREYLVRTYNANDGPSKFDLEDAMVGLLNMQFVHDLKSDDIAQGMVAGMDAGIILSAKQCIEFGLQSLATGFYYQAIDWMQTAVKKVTSQADVTADLEESGIQLETTKKLHDKFLRSSDGTEPAFYVEPVSGADDLTHFQTRKQALYKKNKFRRGREYADINFRAVCQMKPHQTTAEKSKLFCWQETEIHPYYKIAPIKLELLSMYPKAEQVVYHDVLGESLAAYLLKESHEYVLSGTSGTSDPTIRLSATSWIPLGKSEEKTKRILNTVNSMTGLNAIHPKHTSIQLASYTPGCHSNVHPDTDDLLIGTYTSRIATFMFYLTNVEKGGETAFAQSGVRNAPKKGSAIFWYNLLSSGGRDNDTFHGACPVIFGEKLVATQWFFYNDQSHLKCDGADPAGRFEILVNGKSKYKTKKG